MVFSAPRHRDIVDYYKAVSPIEINHTPIKFVDNTEHVGIIRSVHGNLPHIQHRITSHIKALFAVLPSGLARNGHANPAYSLRVQSLYANPVLFSGVAPLTLRKSEIAILHAHHKKNSLTFKTFPKTPLNDS